jgi:protoporphyrinogen/coproporphyrinogen III oxidase
VTRVPVVAVVGGGVSGLAAAWRLQQAPGERRVVVLEQGARTGGVLCRRRVAGGPAGLTVDVGAEAMLARRPEAIRLAEEVGLGGDLVHPATTRAAIWSRGELHPVPAGTLMGVPGDPSALAGLLTAEEVAAAAAEAGRTWPGISDDVDVAGWLCQRVGAAVVERLVEPLLGGVYAGHADRLSLRASVPALWPVAVSGGSLVDAVAARAQDGTDAGGPVFAGIRGGVARLAEALAARIADLRTRACAHALERLPAGTWRLRVGSRPAPELLDADAVVLALPPGRSARLLADVVPSAAADLSSVRTASMAICTVVLPAGSLDGLGDGTPLSGVLVPPVEGRLVKAMTFSSAKWAWVREAAGGADVVRLSVGREGEARVLQCPDDALLTAALADAGELLGRRLAPSAAMVTRWGGGLPQYGVGHVDLVARVRSAVAGLPGLALAGAAYDGLGIPACIATADSAAERVLADLGG